MLFVHLCYSLSLTFLLCVSVMWTSFSWLCCFDFRLESKSGNELAAQKVLLTLKVVKSELEIIISLPISKVKSQSLIHTIQLCFSLTIRLIGTIMKAGGFFVSTEEEAKNIGSKKLIIFLHSIRHWVLAKHLSTLSIVTVR